MVVDWVKVAQIQTSPTTCLLTESAAMETDLPGSVYIIFGSEEKTPCDETEFNMLVQVVSYCMCRDLCIFERRSTI